MASPTTGCRGSGVRRWSRCCVRSTRRRRDGRATSATSCSPVRRQQPSATPAARAACRSTTSGAGSRARGRAPPSARCASDCPTCPRRSPSGWARCSRPRARSVTRPVSPPTCAGSRRCCSASRTPSATTTRPRRSGCPWTSPSWRRWCGRAAARVARRWCRRSTPRVRGGTTGTAATASCSAGSGGTPTRSRGMPTRCGRRWRRPRSTTAWWHSRCWTASRARCSRCSPLSSPTTRPAPAARCAAPHSPSSATAGMRRSAP